MTTTNQLPLSLVSPDPRRIVRRTDGPGSVEAAVELVESGEQARQVAIAIALVVSLPGRTSAELARESLATARILGFNDREWRYVLGRRLSDAEDRGGGPIVGYLNTFHRGSPWRGINTEQKPCAVSGRRSIRWWPRVAEERRAS